MITRNLLLNVVVLFCLAFVSGCLPEALDWSPDEGVAAVCTTDGELYFVDSDGKLSDKICDDAARTAWFSDSVNLLIEKKYICKNWSDVEKCATSELKNRIINIAEEFNKIDNITEVVEYSKREFVDLNLLSGVLLYAKSQKMAFKVEELNFKIEEGLEFTCYSIVKANWKNGEFIEEKIMCQFTGPIWEIAISPNNNYVAFSMFDPQGGLPNGSSLWLLELASGKMKIVDRNIAVCFDWTPDSQKLVYCRNIAEKATDNEVFIGNLMEALVATTDGISEEFEKNVLATITMGYMSRVRCLSDGRIIFSSMEAELPKVNFTEYLDKQMIYILDNKEQVDIVSLVSGEQCEKLIKYNTYWFDISENEKYIYTVSRMGRVAVIELETGIITELEAEGAGEIDALPSWRGNQLCYQHDGYFVLQEINGSETDKKSIGKDWPFNFYH